MKKILIVEDDQNLREELKILLEQNGYQGIILENFEDCVPQIIKENPSLVLLDIQLPETNGVFILKELRKNSNIPVIMVTSKNTEMDEVVSMSYGADDYITKPYNPTILLLHIEALLKRLEQTSNLMPYLDINLNISQSALEKGDIKISLSKNEFQIFHYLLKHKGTIVTREDIMKYLWDTETFIDDNTLTVNMNRLRKKLMEIGLEDVIETKRGMGYLLV